jgi:hypothetical protein
MVLAVAPMQAAQAAGSYTEKLNVYVAGSSALWYFTFSGVNGSGKLTALESTPGLSWYNITAIRTTGWASDFQVFGPNGYDLTRFVPFLPSQGLFLSIGSDSFNDAAAAASALDSYLLTTFTSYSNGTGSYTFYSPVSFSDLMPNTLLKLVPSNEGGFANALAGTFFLSSDSPFIVLEGVKSSSGFTHNLVVGSMTTSGLTNNQPTITGYFGNSVTFLRASNHSSSSVVQFDFLDGTVKSSDAAAVIRNGPGFTGSYTLAMAAGKRFSKINATVVEQPAPLLAFRAVDVGVLKTNGNISVTLSLRNLSPTVTISKLAFSDSWWNTTGVFRLVSGRGSDSVSTSLAPGASTTPVYRLQYTGAATESMTVPVSVVRYQYTLNGVTFNATAALNPIRLSLGADDAAVYATLVPAGGFDKPVGSVQAFNLNVTNVGTLPASSVVVAGHPIAGLAANGGTASIPLSQSALGLLGVNSTLPYNVTYQDPAGTTLTASSNVVSDIFSHTAMHLGFPELTVSAQVASLTDLRTNVTLTFSATNFGSANVTSFRATGALPAGLGCGVVSGAGSSVKGFTCSGNVVTIGYPVLNVTSTLTVYMKYNLTTPLNYVLKPFSFQAATSGSNFTGMSEAVAIPAGLVVSKQFNPSQLFGGMGSTVTLTATNAGPLAAYNATVGSSVDSFDSAASGSVLTKKVGTILAHGNATLSYGVTLQQVSGTQTAAPATASFYFGGTPFSIQGARPKLQVYQPLGVSVSTTPASPEEGKNFTINISITNPTAVQVTNVVFKLPIPSGLGLSNLVNAQVSSGILTVSVGTIAPHGDVTASVQAVASSGITVPFANAKLTFTYAGVTISGTVPKSSGIAIAEDVTTRYIIPTVFIIIAVFAVAFYIRRKASTVPASPK